MNSITEREFLHSPGEEKNYAKSVTKRARFGIRYCERRSRTEYSPLTEYSISANGNDFYFESLQVDVLLNCIYLFWIVVSF
ncbi:unnamed protein product [Haemonchus placei]|uniref:Uncharacterized protein n=1 Tax=Haemonchus placei TaxID=6290 RepID=A0A0N4WM99_HAEPC|nr:unnamed protein product [Haemonchus placei]